MGNGWGMTPSSHPAIHTHTDTHTHTHTHTHTWPRGTPSLLSWKREEKKQTPAPAGVRANLPSSGSRAYLEWEELSSSTRLMSTVCWVSSTCSWAVGSYLAFPELL